MNYTLAFDVYGTLINTSGVFTSLESMIENKAEPFMNLWRSKQLEYSFRRGLMNQYTDFSNCTKEALDYCCQFFTIELNENQKDHLLETYNILPAFDDVKEGLLKLKETNHKLFAFSNGSHDAINKLLVNAKLINYFDGIVSVENVKTFKPSPKVYEYFNSRTNTSKNNSWLISSNPFDIIGATSYGMSSVWLQRSKDSIFDPWSITPTKTINKLTKLHTIL